jgi:hypothetical protein
MVFKLVQNLGLPGLKILKLVDGISCLSASQPTQNPPNKQKIFIEHLLRKNPELLAKLGDVKKCACRNKWLSSSRVVEAHKDCTTQLVQSAVVRVSTKP